MANYLIQYTRCTLLLLALAGVSAQEIRAQDLLSPPIHCVASQDPQPTLAETVNFINAELFEAAECSARNLTHSMPGSADAHYLLGYILNRTDKPDESLKEYTAGAKYRTPAPNDLAVVALDYALLRDYIDAEKWMTQALMSDAKNPMYWYYLGRIQYNLNRFDEAKRTFEQALRLAPNDTRDLYNLGLTYEGFGQTAQAISFYDQAIASEKGSGRRDAQPYYDLGALLIQQNKSAEALPLLQYAATLDPSNPGVHERLARAEEEMGQLAASQKDFESAVTLAPNTASLHLELGRIYQKLHMAVEAKQQFDLCVKMGGRNSSEGGESLDFSKVQQRTIVP